MIQTLPKSNVSQKSNSLHLRNMREYNSLVHAPNCVCFLFFFFLIPVLFKDNEIAEQILKAKKPGQMKALGRKVSNFDEKTWAENREKIVKKGNIAKVTKCFNISQKFNILLLFNLIMYFPNLNLYIYVGNNNSTAV